MRRIRIAAVSYLNTIPFIYGIEHGITGLCFDLLLSPPRICTTNVLNGSADIALVPVASIPYLKDVDIFSDYCIGSYGNVRSVVLFSNTPIKSINKIYLDNHSLTSIMLTRILADEFWGITPQWQEFEDYKCLKPEQGAAYLMIGDKVFENEGKFNYTYDLAEYWQEMTGLPMVFACWVTRKGIEQHITSPINDALAYGINHIDEAIQTKGYGDRPYAHDYLTKNIDFIFDNQKKQALRLFWNKGLKFAQKVNPG